MSLCVHYTYVAATESKRREREKRICMCVSLSPLSLLTRQLIVVNGVKQFVNWDVSMSCSFLIASRIKRASHLLDILPPWLIMNKRQLRQAFFYSMEKWYGHWTLITFLYVWSLNNNNNNDLLSRFLSLFDPYQQDGWLIWPTHAKSSLSFFFLSPDQPDQQDK